MANMPGKTEVDPEEEKRQQEQLQAMDQAEEERKRKWQKQENQREGMRAGIRDKVSGTVTISSLHRRWPHGTSCINKILYLQFSVCHQEPRAESGRRGCGGGIGSNWANWRPARITEHGRRGGCR